MATAKKPDQLIDLLQQIQSRKTVKPEDAARALTQYYKVQDHIKALKKEIEIFRTNRAQPLSGVSDTKDPKNKATNGQAGARNASIARRDTVRQSQPSTVTTTSVDNDTRHQNGQTRANGPPSSLGYNKQHTSPRHVTQTNGNKVKEINQTDAIKQANDVKQTNGALSRRTSVAQLSPKGNKGNNSIIPKTKEDSSVQARLAQQARDISEKDQEIENLRLQNAKLKVTVENRVPAAAQGQATESKSIVSSSEKISFPPPQKLVADFRCIYENEWKSAYTDLEKHYKLGEEVILGLLGGVAKEAYTFCQNAAKQQYDDITKSHAHVIDVFLQPRYVTSTNKDVMTPKSKAIIDKDGHQATRKFLKQYRRVMARVSVPGLTELFEGVVQKDVLSRHTSLRTTPKSLRPYIHRLLEVDWLMSISEPPLFQLWPRCGQLMSREIFAAYEKKGATIVHTVWPALLMYKDGPVADKGVCLVK